MLRRIGVAFAVATFATATMGQERCDTGDSGGGKDRSGKRGLLGATGESGQSNGGGDLHPPL